MALTYFTHAEIAAVINYDKDFDPFLLNLCFGREHVVNERKIDFDVIPSDKRISPFVSPRAQGKILRKKGFSVESYEPGYIKDKQSVDPDHVFTRMPSEPMLQPMTPAQRYAATVIDLAGAARKRLQRRLEVMASQLLVAGAYDMVGEGLDVNVDFGREAANDITLAGNFLWGGTEAVPFDDIESAMLISNNPTRAIVMGPNAYKFLRKTEDFLVLINLDYQSGNQSTLQMGPMQEDENGVVLRGFLASSGTPIYTYSGSYTDPTTGNEVKYVDTNDVILVPAASEGWRCFAAIWDDKANYMGMPEFHKNWSQDDPGTPFYMLQSAPLLAHTDINSTVVIHTQG